jgi:aryl-alcohol dehydrogenase-like predicted oxidoreductase
MYFPAARRDGLGVLARVPLASGLLSGKYRAGVAFQPNDVRATFDREKTGKDLAEIEKIRVAEVPAGIAMSQWAIAWCLKDAVVSATIPGCKDAGQVAANAAAAELVKF